MCLCLQYSLFFAKDTHTHTLICVVATITTANKEQQNNYNNKKKLLRKMKKI